MRPRSTFTPLAIVLGVSLVKEAIEDYKRHQADKKENGREVEVWSRSRRDWKTVRWDQVHVGDILRVTRDQAFPADLVLLSSGTSDGFIRGDHELGRGDQSEVEKAIGATNDMDVTDFQGFNTAVQCDLPNPSLYTFTGNIHLLGPHPHAAGAPGASVDEDGNPRRRSKPQYEIKTHPVSPESILLRDLR